MKVSVVAVVVDAFDVCSAESLRQAGSSRFQPYDCPHNRGELAVDAVVLVDGEDMRVLRLALATEYEQLLTDLEERPEARTDPEIVAYLERVRALTERLSEPEISRSVIKVLDGRLKRIEALLQSADGLGHGTDDWFDRISGALSSADADLTGELARNATHGSSPSLDGGREVPVKVTSVGDGVPPVESPSGRDTFTKPRDKRTPVVPYVRVRIFPPLLRPIRLSSGDRLGLCLPGDGLEMVKVADDKDGRMHPDCACSGWLSDAHPTSAVSDRLVNQRKQGFNAVVGSSGDGLAVDGQCCHACSPSLDQAGVASGFAASSVGEGETGAPDGRGASTVRGARKVRDWEQYRQGFLAAFSVDMHAHTSCHCDWCIGWGDAKRLMRIRGL